VEAAGGGAVYWNAVMTRSARSIRLLTQERILGLDLLRGRKGEGGARAGGDQRDEAPHDEPREAESAPAEARASAEPRTAPVDIHGLPLFGEDKESGR
jgi:hypothetical protein